MKVGILTYHACYNYGACLQAYALQQVIRKRHAQGGRDGGLRLFTRYLPFRFYVKRALAQAGMFNVIRRLLRG